MGVATLDTYKIALGVVLSRAFEVKMGVPTLCPMIDMINAKTELCKFMHKWRVAYREFGQGKWEVGYGGWEGGEKELGQRREAKQKNNDIQLTSMLELEPKTELVI